MRRVFIVCLLISFVSCSNMSKDFIRANAIKNESQTELNGIIEYYSSCYYSLPTSWSQICSFLEQWKNENPDTYCYTSSGGREDILDYMKKNPPQFANYVDSLFLFFPKQKLGCCIYGHPFFWLNNPEKYPKNRPDYMLQFKPAIYDITGNYIFATCYYKTLYNALQNLKYEFSFKKSHNLSLCVIEYDRNSDVIIKRCMNQFPQGLQDVYDSDALKKNLRNYCDSLSNIGRIIIPLNNSSYEMSGNERK